MKTVSLETAKALKEAGWKQYQSSAYWIIKGARVEDGYNKWSEENIECDELVVIGEAIIEEGNVGFSNAPDNQHRTFPAIGIGEYGDDNYIHIPIEDICAAPTADEILDELPGYLYNDFDSLMWLDIRKNDNGYLVHYYDSEYGKSGFITGEKIYFEEETLADAAAQMWIYIKENNLLTP